MLSKLRKLLSSPRRQLPIPKKLHAIWLGSILNTEGKENVLAWRRKNKDYEVNIWVDSALYKGESTTKLFKEFKIWAKKNNINIRDINDTDRSLYERMQNKRFYDDEILSMHKGNNYALLQIFYARKYYVKKVESILIL